MFRRPPPFYAHGVGVEVFSHGTLTKANFLAFERFMHFNNHGHFLMKRTRKERSERYKDRTRMTK